MKNESLNKNDLVLTIERKATHLATQFGTDSKIRRAYLRLGNLCSQGKSFAKALTQVEKEFDIKNQS